MAVKGISRRDALRTLAITAAAGSVLQMIPAEAAEYAHAAIQKEKAASAAGKLLVKGMTLSIRRFRPLSVTANLTWTNTTASILRVGCLALE